MEIKPTLAKKVLNTDVGIFCLAIVFIGVMHAIAFEDRMVLILYYLAAVGSAYALVKRRAIGLASAIVCIVAATMFAQLYYEARPDHWHPVFDAFRDMLGLGALIYLTVRLLMMSYQMQSEEKKRVLQSKVQEQLIAMRADALRQTSHEVRTPLSTITAISETLLDGSTGDLTDDQREFIGDIDEAAQHLLALVNDILDYAKAEAGMIRIAPQPVALVELINQCVSMVGPRADTAGVSVTAQVDPTLNEVVADPLRLRQILLNLLSNAIKYNSEGGNVIVRVRPEGSDKFRISVRDTGRGIAPEHLEHLFEPYYQAAIADQGIGTGLGLAIMKHLSELHGGTIEVESVVDTGTVFTVVLPMEAVAAVSEEKVAQAASIVRPDMSLDLSAV
ncbi:Alkaline phosphatase synthesis sensor protein PhoR [Rubripirellula amarantea]|uniref:histidine kinase n=1 Tax=Rubripirellula amarantea TaxID=2527999 RepID=A0A5C5WKT9_9BACT|nr:HAMP domain-containing sensor histidine kinase [Rubripirellula amarantea]TWT50719.1 Alkaline phosphatase synthesis sensor protein PhoR [Rubripirellula amarantea]